MVNSDLPQYTKFCFYVLEYYPGKAAINLGRYTYVIMNYVAHYRFAFITGPDHMVDFVRDSHVMQKFKEVALKRSSVSFSMGSNLKSCM